ncbi:hypothetical protein DXB56_10175 [Clostridium sp. OM04-7]|jgi:hypothetical protein|uniref:DUF3597 family protein n=1 Tax=Clostridium sp. OM04-7 TaxID=2293042 RepID=UPI000E4D0BCE|nr:hypothetical protein [Clostridium sp. OM04-7]RHV32090.1 hypothetical protein DXB56_10175 [Clostridium sp. OM04-7]DAX10131.1 MAG TPA: lytic transglycosylase [Caudoviricetes sp.]
MAVGSIVDYLNSSGRDSSYAARRKLAEEYGMSGYSGSASQNTKLLRMLQGGAQPTNSTAAKAQELANAAPSNNVTAGVITASGSASGGTEAKPAYQRSDRVNEYYEKTRKLERNKPDEFESKYEGQISDILDNILNRPKFSYTSEDMTNDDLYKMYRDQYLRQGNLAMRDTMGNAASLTGGYGNTYASAAGQQAYDNYVSMLNDKALDFYDRAYQRYNDEGQNLYNQMNVVTGLDNTDYQRYRDTVSDYYNDLNYYNGRYNQEYGYDYGQYQDQVAADQWAQEFAFQKQQAAQEQANWEAEMALARQKAASSGGSGGRRRSSSSKKKSSSSSTQNTMGWQEAHDVYISALNTQGQAVADEIMNSLEKDGLVDMYKDERQKDALGPEVRAKLDKVLATGLTRNSNTVHTKESAAKEKLADEWKKKWEKVK